MKSHNPDYTLIVIVFALIVFGLIILSSASIVISRDFFGQNYYFLKHQLVYSLPLAIIAFLIMQKLHYKNLQKISFPFLIISIILLTLVFFPGLSYGNDGVKRWVSIQSFSFQPFEIAKLSFIIYLSAIISRQRTNKKANLIPVLFSLVTIGTLVMLQPNMSALIILVMISTVIYFLSGMKLSYLFMAGIVIILLLAVLANTASYRMARLTVFLHPELDPQGIGYQTNQALLAIGSGGVFGLGLGHSIQKWNYLPEVIGDSIFAVAAEELGLFGAGLLVILFLLFAWRGMQIARKAPDKFSYLLAGSITTCLFFQAFINIGSISRMIPMTGMPLPLISYGGSSLVITLASIGILINISKYT
ncbi:putative lipid II flippase FtsW [Patescibacteria group bacterium]